MLTQIRERATGWIAWAIVILITIPFALWGVNSYFTQGYNVSVAEYDGGEIDYATYNNALYRERERVRQSIGQGGDSYYLSSSFLGPRVINALVSERLLIDDMVRQGYRISDAQLLETIVAEENFHDENGFSQAIYERMLTVSGLSTTEFEASLRNSAAIQQLQTGFIESSLSRDHEVDHILGLRYQQRVGQYAVIDATALLPEVEVTDDEIQKEYEDNQYLYEEPEQVKVQYIEILFEDLAQGYEPSEETLRSLYSEQLADFQREEERSVSHILIEIPEGDSDEAMRQANELLERIEAGESFEDLAREHSTDVGSAEGGGSIGWINRGATVPEFEASAFSLEVGQVSEPVQSSFGVHIIRLDEIKASEVKEFEEVQDELYARAKRAQADAEMFEIIEELSNIVYEQPDSLEPAADQMGLEIKDSEWFEQNDGLGIAANEAVRQAAFSDDVLNNEFNSGVIELEDGDHLVLRRLDYRESSLLPLEEVRAQITERLLTDKSVEKAEELAANLVQQLKDGGDWNETLANNGLEAVDLPSTIAEATEIFEHHLLQDVAESGKPGSNGVAYGFGYDGDKRFSIFRVTDVVLGDHTLATDSEQQAIEQALRQRFGLGLYENYRLSLNDGVDIDINEELINQEPM